MFKIPPHCHWQFVAYDSKEPGPQGMAYMGAVSVDVVATSYAEALKKAETWRPLTGDRAGFELRAITEHIAGTCRN